MNIPVSNGPKTFLRLKVQSGEFSSEGAIVEVALRRLQEQEPATREGLIDHDFVESCGREGDGRVTLAEVLRATSKIPGSMARAIIEEERADRF